MGAEDRDKHEGDGPLLPDELDILDGAQKDEYGEREGAVPKASAGPEDRPSDPAEPTNPA